jgi:hypothetical protein
MNHTNVARLLACLALAGCAARSGSTETVCASRFGRSCTSYEVRETAQGKSSRESHDAVARESARTSGTAFFPSQIPGESSFHYLGRVAKENGGASR